MTGMKPLTLADIDLSKPCTIAAWLGVDDCPDWKQLGKELTLTAAECHAFFTWLANNKNWRAKGNKAIMHSIGFTDIVLGFDDYTFSRMQGVGIRPITDETIAVFNKIYKWRHSHMKKGESLAGFRGKLKDKGQYLTFLMDASALPEVAEARKEAYDAAYGEVFEPCLDAC